MRYVLLKQDDGSWVIKVYSMSGKLAGCVENIKSIGHAKEILSMLEGEYRIADQLSQTAKRTA